MKLATATTVLALVIGSAASAMTAPIVTDYRDAAQNALGQVNSGHVKSVPLSSYISDGRSAALITSDEVSVTTFNGTSRPMDSTDYR